MGNVKIGNGGTGVVVVEVEVVVAFFTEFSLSVGRSVDHRNGRSVGRCAGR